MSAAQMAEEPGRCEARCAQVVGAPSWGAHSLSLVTNNFVAGRGTQQHPSALWEEGAEWGFDLFDLVCFYLLVSLMAIDNT